MHIPWNLLMRCPHTCASLHQPSGVGLWTKHCYHLDISMACSLHVLSAMCSLAVDDLAVREMHKHVSDGYAHPLRCCVKTQQAPVCVSCLKRKGCCCLSNKLQLDLCSQVKGVPDGMVRHYVHRMKVRQKSCDSTGEKKYCTTT